MKSRLETAQPARAAIVACFVSGVVTHLFGLVNILHNYDDIAQQPKGYGTGITSGRWLLSILGDLFGAIEADYNLPVVNGLLFIILIAFSAGLFVSVMQIQNQKLAALIGILFIVFPSAFSTLVFRYTSVYYGIGIFLSVLAAWVLLRFQYGWILSALCVAASMGIYQAYVPITIGIFVLLLLKQTITDNDFRKLVYRSLFYCLVLLLGLLMYFVFLNFGLKIYGTELSDYQGVNEMGKISLSRLPELSWKAMYSVIMLPFKDYCGLAASRLIKISYLLIACISAILFSFLIYQKKRKRIVLFSALLCFIFPVSLNFIVIMCPDSWVYTLMVYSFVLIPCVPIILFENLLPNEGTKKIKTTILKRLLYFVTILLICGYAYQTNINYTALYYANRQVENYLNSMVVQVRSAEGFHTELEWAFLGEIEDPLLDCYWKYEMNIGGVEFTEYLLKRYSLDDWIHNYYGYQLPTVDNERIAELSTCDEVKRMPCWPDQGSIKVIGNTVVIKCQELSQ